MGRCPSCGEPLDEAATGCRCCGATLVALPSPPAPIEPARRSALRRPGALAVTAVVVVVVLVAVTVVLGRASKPAASPRAGGSLAPASVVGMVSSVPPSAFTKAGISGQVLAAPQVIPAGQPVLAEGGKPLIVYIGAEYCPFCAAERWPLVIALARFGSFSNLGVTSSAASDTDPGTPTFSFHGATYTSAYIAFEGVETETNQPVKNGQGYTTLDTPTAAQQALFRRYDTTPYTTAPGSIPFIDFANRYVEIGASVDPSLLTGFSLRRIAEQAVDPSTVIGGSVLSSANFLTAAICQVTGGQPRSVCTRPEIAATFEGG